jgi:hypothetical protein
LHQQAVPHEQDDRERNLRRHHSPAQKSAAADSAAARTFERGIQVGARSLPGRRGAGDDRCEGGNGQGEQQHSRVEGDIRADGQFHRVDGLEIANGGIGHRQTQNPADRGQGHRLGEKLAEQPGPSAADGSPHGKFAGTAERPAQQQIGHVDAGNQQHQTDGSEKNPKRGSQVASGEPGQLLLHRVDDGAEIAPLIVGVQSREQRGKFRLRTGDGDTGLEPADGNGHHFVHVGRGGQN